MRESVKRKVVSIFAAVALLLTAVPWLPTFAAQETADASSIRLTTIEGTVTVAGQGGKAVSAFENMRMQSGYSLKTGQASYAGFSLDDVKAARLDALSTAEVRKKGKKLELLLPEGSVFCDIKEPLGADETMNIRTSTMMTGIRGTVLYVRVIDANTSIVYVLEGSVVLQGIDPVTGQQASVTVEAGQKGTAVAGSGFGANPQSQNVGAYVEAFSKEEIAGYVLMEVAADNDLAARLEAAGWDIQWMRENALRRLQEDQKDAADKLAALAGLEQDGEKRIFDQVYGSEDSDSDSDRKEARRIVEMTMPVNAQEVADRLGSEDVVLNRAAGDEELYNFYIDRDFTVPAGGSFTVGAGITPWVEERATLAVDGTMKTAESLYNSGAVLNTGAHTLDIGGDYLASGELNNTGRLLIGGSLIAEGGAVNNAGKGTIAVREDMNAGRTELSLGGGSVSVGGSLNINTDLGVQVALDDNVEVNGSVILFEGIFEIKGGTYRNGIQSGSAVVEMTGGSVLSGGAECALEDMGGSEIRLSGGKVTAGKDAVAAVRMNEGELTIEANVLRVEDITRTSFVEGIGMLKLGGAQAVNIEELQEEDMEAVEGAGGWELKLFSKQARSSAARRRAGGAQSGGAGGTGTDGAGIASPSEAKPDDGKTEGVENAIPTASPSSAGHS